MLDPGVMQSVPDVRLGGGTYPRVGHKHVAVAQTPIDQCTNLTELVFQLRQSQRGACTPGVLALQDERANKKIPHTLTRWIMPDALERTVAPGVIGIRE